ncbi:hypothetical protein [Streptomyces sp. NPDC008121]|uniref:hypothetical protein n=1 Tax=Streptomyces sp. NPDC008121 TaxID=3364809 RepID=UPI0036EAA769
MLPIFFVRDEITRAYEVKGGPVRVIQTLVAHLTVQGRASLNGTGWLAVRLSRRNRGNQARACCAAASRRAARRP